jgi:hypothetical protein
MIGERITYNILFIALIIPWISYYLAAGPNAIFLPCLANQC